jgi:hypothetical protein
MRRCYPATLAPEMIAKHAAGKFWAISATATPIAAVARKGEAVGDPESPHVRDYIEAVHVSPLAPDLLHSIRRYHDRDERGPRCVEGPLRQFD